MTTPEKARRMGLAGEVTLCSFVFTFAFRCLGTQLKKVKGCMVAELEILGAVPRGWLEMGMRKSLALKLPRHIQSTRKAHSQALH